MIAPPDNRTRLKLPRLAREYRTMAAMIAIHCRGHHHVHDAGCRECAELLDYAGRRLDRCPFRDSKPTCANCSVHCYSDERRAQMKTVMRYAGPKMIWRHPVLALAHIRDGSRAVPHLPRPRTR